MSIEYETTGRVARIMVNRPDAKNAMDAQAYSALHTAIDTFSADAVASVAIIGGRGDHFTVGGDMNAYVDRPTEVWREEGARSPSVALQEALWKCPKPLIAAVQGYCVGWGMVVLIASDIRVLADDAKIGFTNLRYFGGAGSGGFVERALLQLPYARAIDMLLTGRLLDAEEALSYGVATEVCDRAELVTRVDEWAERVLATPPMVLQTVKAAARRLHDTMLGRLYEDTERAGLRYFMTEDFSEGMNAWRERRPPSWSGC